MRRISHLVTLIIVVLPLLIYYKSPVLVSELTTLIEISMIPLVLFALIIKYKNLSILNVKEYLLFIYWLVFITLIMVLFSPFGSSSYEHTNYFIFLIIQCIIFFFGLSILFDFEYGMRSYILITKVAISFLLVQIFSFYILNISINGKIPFLELHDVYKDAFNNLNNKVSFVRYVRFSSFFSEPSHYALYVSPYLCMSLFGFKHMVKSNILYAGFITLTIFLSMSGNGIILSGIVWVLYFLTRGNRDIIKRIAFILLGFILILILYNILIRFEVFSQTVDRLFISDGNVSSKADYRIYRGFDLFKQMPIVYQLFGVGFKNATSMANHFGIFTKYDIVGANSEYLNAIAQVLIYSGVIGLFLYSLFIKELYCKCGICGKVLIIVLLSASVSSSIFMEANWQLYIILIFAELRNKECSKYIYNGATKAER